MYNCALAQSDKKGFPRPTNVYLLQNENLVDYAHVESLASYAMEIQPLRIVLQHIVLSTISIVL